MMNVVTLALTIFIVRIVDVSLATFRTISTVKGKALIASTIGFVEAGIWFLIVKEAITSGTNNPLIVMAYAGGFAIGTLIGGLLSAKLIKGSSSVQVITSNTDLVHQIRDKGYGVSQIEVKGKNDVKKDMLIIEVKNNTIGKLRKYIKEQDEHAFMVVTESKIAANGYIK